MLAHNSISLLQRIHDQGSVALYDWEDPSSIAGLEEAISQKLVRDSSSGWNAQSYYVLTGKGRRLLGLPPEPLSFAWWAASLRRLIGR